MCVSGTLPYVLTCSRHPERKMNDNVCSAMLLFISFAEVNGFSDTYVVSNVKDLVVGSSILLEFLSPLLLLDGSVVKERKEFLLRSFPRAEYTREGRISSPTTRPSLHLPVRQVIRLPGQPRPVLLLPRLSPDSFFSYRKL